MQLKLAERAMQVEAARLMIDKAVCAEQRRTSSVRRAAWQNASPTRWCATCAAEGGAADGRQAIEGIAAEQRLATPGDGVFGGTIHIQKVRYRLGAIGRRSAVAERWKGQ